MPRGWVWLQLAVAWLPLWALFTAIMLIVHGVSLSVAAFGALRMIVGGALLGIVVYRFASGTPWPHPFRLTFIAVHVLAALVYAATWYILLSLIDSLVTGHLAFTRGPGLGIWLFTGVWLYLVVASVAHANLAAQRTARIEAQAVRMQLDALRAQLHPHFLFNALHTIVQLIPTAPRAAANAAEQLAGALRTTIDEQRDLVPLRQEWAFVERYLSIERIRFGERLRVLCEIDEPAGEVLLPSFALQTLVENALRHGAAPRIETTQLSILASASGDTMTLTVSDDGIGVNLQDIESTKGSGLRRLRERLRGLYGGRAQLELSSKPDGGFTAILRVPRLSTVMMEESYVEE